MSRALRRRYGRAELPILYRFREDYYPSGGLIRALKREVSAAGGRVREWDEGPVMFVGICGGRRSDTRRLGEIAFAYNKAKRYFNVASHRGPNTFEIESKLALEDFERRVGRHR